MKSLLILTAVAALVGLALVLAQPGTLKSFGEKLNDAVFGYMARSGLVLGMAEINSRQKTAIAAGQKVLAVYQGVPRCLVFNSPAAAAWAQNDTFASGLKIPKGSRLLACSQLSVGVLGASVTADVGLRNFDTGVEIDLDGIASNVAVATASTVALNNGVLLGSGVDYVVPADAEVVVTLEGANPTDDIQIRGEIWYLPPG